VERGRAIQENGWGKKIEDTERGEEGQYAQNGELDLPSLKCSCQ